MNKSRELLIDRHGMELNYKNTKKYLNIIIHLANLLWYIMQYTYKQVFFAVMKLNVENFSGLRLLSVGNMQKIIGQNKKGKSASDLLVAIAYNL